MDWSDLLFTFEGRINRAKFWLAMLIWVVAQAVAAGMIVASYVLLGDFFPLGAIVVFLLVVIPLLVSGFAVGVKRLHDRDKSGWWLLLLCVLPAVLELVAQSMGDAGRPWDIASLVISVWAIVELGCLRGTAGPNSYGDDPLEAAAAQSA